MTEPSPKRHRRFLRFSLRGLMLLILVISAGVYWPIHKARKQGIAVAALRKQGCELRCGGVSGDSLSLVEQLRQLLGEVEPRNVFGMNASSKITDADLVHLRSLPHLVALNLWRAQITDAGVVHLDSLTQMFELDLDDTQVTDAGLVHLEGLKQLRELHLDHTRVTDAGLVHLRGLANLEQLSLQNTKLTDAGLPYLQGLVQLKQLNHYGASVTYDGVQELRKSLPECSMNCIHTVQMPKWMYLSER